MDHTELEKAAAADGNDHVPMWQLALPSQAGLTTHGWQNGKPNVGTCSSLDLSAWRWDQPLPSHKLNYPAHPLLIWERRIA